MATPKIVSGDDIVIPVTLLKNGLTFVIAPEAIIKVRLVAEDRLSTYTEEITIPTGGAGSDLAESLIIVMLAPLDTVAVTYQGNMLLEIQVDDGIKITWFVKVNMIKGNIA